MAGCTPRATTTTCRICKGSKFSAFVEDTNDGADAGLSARRGAFGHQDPHRFAQCLQPEHLWAPDLSVQRRTDRGCRWWRRPAASRSARSSTTRSAMPSPAASSGGPNSEFKLVADGLWTHLNDPQIGYNESYYFPCGTDQNGNSEWTNPDDQERRGHRRHRQRLPAGNGEQHRWIAWSPPRCSG